MFPWRVFDGEATKRIIMDAMRSMVDDMSFEDTEIIVACFLYEIDIS